MDVRRRLDELIRERGEDYASLSRLIGRNPTYIQQFIRRGTPRRLSEEDRRRLAAHLAIDERVLGAPQDALARALSVPAFDERTPGDYLQLPYFEVGASAGPGAHAEDRRAAPSIAFQARFVRQLASGDPSRLSVISVAGDSMLPTLGDGDEILVDAADSGHRLRDGIYVLRLDDALMVKRLALNPASRRLSIKSDNPAYPSWDGCDPSAVSIIGRVVWLGRRIG
jgi:phage repressor protein C with HTH and peptisase S24 domain